MGIDPDVAKLWKEFREDPSEPVTFISFHQTNGGNSDDEFVSQESKDRYGHYAVQGTPDAQFDGGYIFNFDGGFDSSDVGFANAAGLASAAYLDSFGPLS